MPCVLTSPLCPDSIILTNQRPVFMSGDSCRPIRGQSVQIFQFVNCQKSMVHWPKFMGFLNAKCCLGCWLVFRAWVSYKIASSDAVMLRRDFPDSSFHITELFPVFTACHACDSLDQSEASSQVTWLVFTNQRPESCKHCQWRSRFRHETKINRARFLK